MKIPFNQPCIGKEEEEAVLQALRSHTLRGGGAFTKRVQRQMEAWLGVAHVLLTTSCTHALEMAMMVLGIGEGEEVIMPSFNFVSSANAAVLRGATPVFADICPDTMNICPEDIARKITPNTKAIVPVHNAPFARQLLDEHAELSATQQYSNRLIRLPLYPDLDLTEALLDHITQIIHDALPN